MGRMTEGRVTQEGLPSGRDPQKGILRIPRIAQEESSGAGLPERAVSEEPLLRNVHRLKTLRCILYTLSFTGMLVCVNVNTERSPSAQKSSLWLQNEPESVR